MIESTSQFWQILLAHSSAVFDARDMRQISLVCHGAHSATVDAKVRTAWAQARFGTLLSLPVLYSQHPSLLSQPTLARIVPIRFLALLLVREKQAEARFNQQTANHLKYQRDVKRMLEWRAMELEAQRLTKENIYSDDESAMSPEGAAMRDIHDPRSESEIEQDDETSKRHHNRTSMDLALVPLPSLPEIEHVPLPSPLPETPTSRLPANIADSIIDAAQDYYGTVFYAAHAPKSISERIALLPEELAWTASLEGAGGNSNPSVEWPFDDADMFCFLLRHGMEVNALLSTDIASGNPISKSPNDPVVVAVNTTAYATNRIQETWRRICSSIRALISHHKFHPALVLDNEKYLAGLKQYMHKPCFNLAADIKDSSGAEERKWILSEVLHFDAELGRMLAMHAGVDSSTVEMEIMYWTLIDSRIHLPLHPLHPPTAEELEHMQTTLSKLPTPIPTPILRRYLKSHASKHSIYRLVQYLPPQTPSTSAVLTNTFDDLIESLLSPTNLLSMTNPGPAFTAVDNLVEAASLGPGSVYAHIAIPDADLLAYTTFEKYTAFRTAAITAALNHLQDQAVDDDDLHDLVSAYTAPNTTATASQPCPPPPFLTRLAAQSSSLPWSVWNYLVQRYPTNQSWRVFPESQEIVSILLNDLVVRRGVLSHQDHAPEESVAREWFGEKEADVAVAEFLRSVKRAGDVDIVVYPVTVLEICARVLEEASGRGDGVDVGGEPGVGKVLARFVMVMERVERVVLSAAGPREMMVEKKMLREDEGGEKEEDTSVLVSPTGANPWTSGTQPTVSDSTPPIVRRWVDLLTAAVIENPAWQQVLNKSSTTDEVLSESVSEPVRFYWAVVSLVEDGLNLGAPAHARFAAWVKEVEARQKRLSYLTPPNVNILSQQNDPNSVTNGTTSVFSKWTSAMGSSKVFKSWSESTAKMTASFSAHPAAAKFGESASKVGENAAKFGSSIASSPAVAKLNANAVKLGAQLQENITVGSQHISAAVSDAATKWNTRGNTKSGGPSDEELAQKQIEAGPVDLLSKGDAEKQKQAWDNAWDRLSSRLSTQKK